MDASKDNPNIKNINKKKGYILECEESQEAGGLQLAWHLCGPQDCLASLSISALPPSAWTLSSNKTS